MKPWRQIARPHRDVLEGTFQQSEFAADISQVVQGNASPEYQDAEKFFARTYITEGMRLLLISVARRLAGQAGDPVIQLQTNFGGGGGTGVSVPPVGFLVVGPTGEVELLNVGVSTPEADKIESISNIIEKSPDLISKIAAIFRKESKKESTDEKIEPASDEEAK